MLSEIYAKLNRFALSCARDTFETPCGESVTKSRSVHFTLLKLVLVEKEGEREYLVKTRCIRGTLNKRRFTGDAAVRNVNFKCIRLVAPICADGLRNEVITKASSLHVGGATISRARFKKIR